MRWGLVRCARRRGCSISVNDGTFSRDSSAFVGSKTNACSTRHAVRRSSRSYFPTEDMLGSDAAMVP